MERQIIEYILTETRGAIGDVQRIEPVLGGYSTDRKFALWRDGEPRFLLRVAGGADPARWAEQLHWIGVHHANGVLCPAVHASGVVEAANAVYSVLDYLPGAAATEALPELPATRQYEIGEVAGRQLHKMHDVEGREAPHDWRARLRRKYERYRSIMREARLAFQGQETVEAYVEDHESLLAGRPVRFQHDDFHPGNLIVRDGRFVGVIDFNRFDWGDPWQDFYKVAMFTAPLSPAFARGQVAGYFGGRPPEAFWPLYNLYVAMAIVFSLGWSTQQPEPQIDIFRKIGSDILSSHDFTDSGPPAWFKGC